MKSAKISILIDFHISVVAGLFAAIGLAVQGSTGPAITFAILSAITAVALMLWWIVQVSKHSDETREKVKKGVDAISLMFIAVLVGVVFWLKVRGEWDEPSRVNGHLSTDVKILVWDIVPFTFGFFWLLFRYANALAARFPVLFSHDGRPGLLFYFAQLVLALVFLERLFAFPDWVLAPLWITALVGFTWFAFRQSSKMKPNKANRDDWDNSGGPPDGHTGSQF